MSAQAPTDFVMGSAEANRDSVTFYLQNTSSCRLNAVAVRVAHNSTTFTSSEANLNVDLVPQESGVFVMRLSEVAGADWQWAIDGVSLSDCAQAGQVNFEKVSFAPAQTAQPVVHTIQRGETVFVIAEQYGITARELMDANNMDSEALIFGRELIIPVANAPLRGEFRAHTVSEGDTLFGIAQRYETSVPLIERANCLRADATLRVGNELRIPPTGAESVPDGCG